MRLNILDHLTLSAYLSMAMIIATGGLFALSCLLLFLVEFVFKLVAVPLIFSLAMACLAYGLFKRKILQNPIPA